ncbi:hypothetical protein B0H12DRAFT_1235573 [Mycena haematopus]|nr:hypothetical protein B0H12DRAFT_1235573 [Mycena haematopus]
MSFSFAKFASALASVSIPQRIISLISLTSTRKNALATTLALAPTRTSGIVTPTRTIIAQKCPSFWASCLLVSLLVGIALASGWSRSPRFGGRLKRPGTPQPPPPPPPPPAPAQNDANASNDRNEDTADENGGDGDDDPQEDGGVIDANGQDDDLVTAAAPAPEDPPPPPSGVDEDDDNGERTGTRGGFPWFVLLLLGILAFQRRNRYVVNVPAQSSVDISAASATIPGLLERRDESTCKAPPSSISNPAPLSSFNASQPVDLDAVLAPPQILDTAAPATQSLAPVARRNGLAFSRNLFSVLVVLPMLWLAGTVAWMLRGNPSRREVEDIPDPPPLRAVRLAVFALPALALPVLALPVLALPLLALPALALPALATTSPQLRPIHEKIAFLKTRTAERIACQASSIKTDVEQQEPSPTTSPQLRPIHERIAFIRTRTADRIARQADGIETDDGEQERRRRVYAVQMEIWRRLYEPQLGEQEEETA